jgi:hypothetical protein
VALEPVIDPPTQVAQAIPAAKPAGTPP